MSLGDKAARGSKVVLLTQAFRATLQFASMIILARLLDPSAFGLIAMVTSVIGIADLIRDFGLSSAAIQSKTLSDGERTNLFWVNLGFGALCTAVVAGCAPLVQSLYDQSGLVPIVLSLSGVFVISGANTQFRADLTRSMRYGKIAVADIAAQVAGIAVAASLAVAGAGVWALVAQQLVVAVVSLVMNVVSTRWLPGLPRRNVSLRRFFVFGSSLFATQTLTYLTKNVDNVALGIVSGPFQLGLYSRAYQLLMTPLNQINAPMTGVALPVLSTIQDDDERFSRYLDRAQLVACYLTASIFAVAAGVAVPLTLVLFGSEWADVAPIFAILAVGGVFRSIQQIAYWTYLAKGRTTAQLKMILVTRPIMIAIILAGVPWGPLGVAVGHSVAYFLFWLASVWHVGRVTGVDSARLIRNAVRPVLVVCLPAGAVAFAATLLPLPAALRLAAGVLAAGLLVSVTVAVVPAVRADVRVLADFVRRAGRRTS